jgi:hypothetical protein
MLCRMLLTLGRSNMLKLTRPRGIHPADVMFFFSLVFLLFQCIRTNFDANQDFKTMRYFWNSRNVDWQISFGWCSEDLEQNLIL